VAYLSRFLCFKTKFFILPIQATILSEVFISFGTWKLKIKRTKGDENIEKYNN